MIRALAFLSDGRPLDYGSRLARLRWRRAVGPEVAAEWDPAAPAGPAIARADLWFVVVDPAALPLGGAAIPDPPAGRILTAAGAVPVEPPFAHTLRELEGCRIGADGREGAVGPAAFAFRAADFPARGQRNY